MRITSKKKFREFWAIHPNAETPLRAWAKVVESSDWRTFAEARQTYSHADQVGRLTVFNIGGNKFRLVVAIHFNRGVLYVRHVLTHEEYDSGVWKQG